MPCGCFVFPNMMNDFVDELKMLLPLTTKFDFYEPGSTSMVCDITNSLDPRSVVQHEQVLDVDCSSAQTLRMDLK